MVFSLFDCFVFDLDSLFALFWDTFLVVDVLNGFVNWLRGLVGIWF